MSTNQNIKNTIEEGDVLEFEYRLKPSNNPNAQALKINEIQKIIIGKDELFPGFDECIIGKDSTEKFLEVHDFKLPEEHLMFPNEMVHLGIKIIKHEKPSSKEELESKLDNQTINDNKNKEDNLETTSENNKSQKNEDIEKSTEINSSLVDENRFLIKKIEKLEQEIENNLNAFKLKQEEISKKAQNEVSKIKNEIKEKAKEEIEHNKKFALQKIVENLLDPLNNLYLSVEFGSNQTDEAVSAYVKGFKLIVNQIFQTLDSFGVSIIQPKEGDIFNPEFDEVCDIVESDKYQKDQIVTVISRGYKLNNRVLKPAKVVVAK